MFHVKHVEPPFVITGYKNLFIPIGRKALAGNAEKKNRLRSLKNVETKACRKLVSRRHCATCAYHHLASRLMEATNILNDS